MKNKSAFLQVILLIALVFVCIATILIVALVAGSIEKPLLDFENLNFANMIPVFIFGGLFTGFAVTIALLFTSRTLFHKVKEYIEADNNDNNKK